jgi:hypothetical protein
MSESIPEGILDLIPIQLESPIMRENNPEPMHRLPSVCIQENIRCIFEMGSYIE